VKIIRQNLQLVKHTDNTSSFRLQQQAESLELQNYKTAFLVGCKRRLTVINRTANETSKPLATRC